MIEQLHSLATSVGAQRITLSVGDNGQGQASVVIQAVLGTAPNDMSKAAALHRQALAQPLLIAGFAGEVDAQLDTLLDGYLQSTKPAMDRLVTNAEQIASKNEDAASITGEDAESTANDSSENAQENNDDIDKFATGEADSL